MQDGLIRQFKYVAGISSLRSDATVEASNEVSPPPEELDATDLYGSEVVDYPPLPTEEKIEEYRGRRVLRSPPRADVNLNVPYIHQLWDTPEDFDGRSACGPASAAMVLAYYGLLEPKPIELTHPYPHTSDYGWYVCNTFTHGGTTFDAPSGTRTGSAAGFYGAVVDRISNGWGAHWSSENGRGIRPLMDVFLPPIGNTVRFLDRPKQPGTNFIEREPAEGAMKACLDAGHPVIASGFFWDRYHHLIVVRGYYEDEGGLHWIVKDPYGFKTTGSGFDGGNVVYEFDEIKPKWMCLFSRATALNYAPSNKDYNKPHNCLKVSHACCVKKRDERGLVCPS